MKYKTKTHKICIDIRDWIQDLFSDLESGLSQREDSRAFGAMMRRESQLLGQKFARILVALRLTYLEDVQFLILHVQSKEWFMEST